MVSLSDFVSDDGHHISRRVFSSAEIYQQELKHIFGKNWVYLTHESQIPKAGDYVLAYIGETSVIVARDKHSEIHASINSCAHRGLPVARADRGNTKRFVCPYHAWSFDIDGKLVATPQERKLGVELCKDNHSLKKVPRLASYAGLIFGSMDDSVEPLDDFLGDMRWYLDCMFDRSSGGAIVVGAPHKWQIKCNWKLPVENQLGDVAHGPMLHAAMVAGTPQVDEIENYGFNIVPEQGHGLAVRLMPENTALENKIWSVDGLTMFDKEVIQYMKDQHAEVEQRLGRIRARIKPLCYSVYPNLSLLWPNQTIRTSHPRGPGLTEYWSWWVVDKNIPEDIKLKIQRNYTFLFGPGGMLEQEDSEAWSQQYIGTTVDYSDDQKLYYGFGDGQESTHLELKGKVGSVYNEFYAREFYKRWRKELEQGMNQNQEHSAIIAMRSL